MKQKGAVAIFLTIFVLSLMLVISLAAAFLVIKEIQASALIEDSIKAFYAAESGMEDALYQIKNGTYCPGSETTPSYDCNSYSGNLFKLTEAYYTVQARFIDYRTPYKITSKGFFGKASRRVRTEPEFYQD